MGNGSKGKSPHSFLFFKGYPNTLGLVKFLDRPEQEDSVIVKVLKKQGAIPFVKTNTSQAILK